MKLVVKVDFGEVEMTEKDKAELDEYIKAMTLLMQLQCDSHEIECFVEE